MCLEVLRGALTVAAAVRVGAAIDTRAEHADIKFLAASAISPRWFLSQAPEFMELGGYAACPVEAVAAARRQANHLVVSARIHRTNARGVRYMSHEKSHCHCVG